MLCGPSQRRPTQAAALSNPNCLKRTIRRFAISSQPQRLAAASNPNCLSGVLDAMSRDDNGKVRGAAAANTAYCAKIALRLSAIRGYADSLSPMRVSPAKRCRARQNAERTDLMCCAIPAARRICSARS